MSDLTLTRLTYALILVGAWWVIMGLQRAHIVFDVMRLSGVALLLAGLVSGGVVIYRTCTDR